MSIGMMIICLIGGLAGALSTAYLLLSFPAIIAWKIYRRIKFGYTLYQKTAGHGFGSPVCGPEYQAIPQASPISRTSSAATQAMPHCQSTT